MEQSKLLLRDGEISKPDTYAAELHLYSSSSQGQDSASTRVGRDSREATDRSQAPVVMRRSERRFTFGVRAAFSFPQNDLELTTGKALNFAAGPYGELRLGKNHRLKQVGEYWYFTPGRQYKNSPARMQKIDTRVSATVLGGEYSYRIAPVGRRLVITGGLHLVRWSVNSVDEVTFTPGATQIASGNSHWIRPGESLGLGYQISRRLNV